MTLRMKEKLLSVCIAAALGGGAAWAADSPLEQARTLLREGKPAAAYALLEAQEFERAGDVEYDTLLGVAALDGGKPDKATLAFERVLATDPKAAGARLDMARAYFALGDYPRARQELDIVAQYSPPPAARLVIDQYRKAIDEREQARRTAVSGYVEGFAGYDDNITSVVSDFTNAVQATWLLVGSTPSANAIKRSSGILGGAAGVDVKHHVSEALALTAGADFRHREVLNASNYRSEQLDLRAGASYSVGVDTYRAGLTLQDYLQRTDLPTADRNAIGINAEWRHTVGAADQGTLFALATRQRFPDIRVNDINTVAWGAGWLHLFAGARKPLLYVNLLNGQDNALNEIPGAPAGTDNSKRFWNGRVYGQLSLNDAADLFTSVGLLYRSDRSAYARSSVFSQIEYGSDHVSDATLGMNWRPARDWTVRPQVTYAENRSNVPLSEYRRTEFTVTVRYDLH